MEARRDKLRAGCAFLFALASVAAVNAERLSPPGYASVQMTRGPQNHLLIAAQVNGRPAILLVDTGADITFIRRDRAQAFGVQTMAREVRRRGRSFTLGAVTNLAAGSANFGAATVALADASQFRGTAAGGRAADGVLGLDLLRRHKAIINCRTRELFLKMSDGPPLDLSATTATLGFTRIRLDQTRRGGVTASCVVHGRRGRLLVDTGAFVTGLDDDGLRGRGITTRPSALTSRGIDGEIRPVQLAQIDDFQIGAVRIAPQTFAVIDLYGKKKPLRTYTGVGQVEYYRPFPAADRIIGVLGNELLDQRRAIIDFGSLTLFMK